MPAIHSCSQLQTATTTLATRDESLSIFDRQWAQLEEQLTLLVGRLDGTAPPPAETSSSNGLLRLSTPVAPLVVGAAAADAALQARCSRMQELGRTLVERALGSSSTAAAANGGALEAERHELSAKVALLDDRCARAEASVATLTERIAAANEQADKAVKALNRERFKRTGVEDGCAASAAPAAAAKPDLEAAATAASAAAATAASGGGADAGGATAAAAAAEAKAELEASRQQGQQWLSELAEARQDAARARAAEQEMAARPPDEGQLRTHPAYQQLHAHAKEMGERAQVAEARLQQYRTDAAALNTMRHSEHSRFEEYRAQHSAQAADEAKQKAAELAIALADRRTIELQLAQLSMGHKREQERVADLDSRLRFALREQKRATDEIARLRAEVSGKERERDEARAAEQEKAKAAHAAELLVESLRAAAANGAALEPSTAEKGQHEALVRLGSAEQKAAQAQQELKALKGANEALMSEIEEVSTTYEEVQTKNDELRQTLQLKEEALNRAKGDKLRADSTAAMLKQEHEKLTAKVERLGQLSESVSQLRGSYETQLRKSATALQKKDDEIAAFQALLGTQKAQLKEAQAAAQHAAALLRISQDAEGRSKEREERANASAAAEVANAKRLSAELDGANRRVSRMQAGGNGGKGSALAKLGDDPVSEQLEFYRSKVKCTLCRTNDKDAIISKCMHAFCRECIQKRLDVRNRKCPACAVQFDFQSVKDLFLTN